MSMFKTVSDDVVSKVEAAIREAIPGATEVEVDNTHGGHYTIRVVAPEFEGESLVNKQRMVYSAITPFMSGPNAPVHAVDQLVTELPEG